MEHHQPHHHHTTSSSIEKEIHVKEELRLRAMSWLLVLDYVNQDIAGKGGNMEHVPEDPTGIVSSIICGV